LAILEAEKVNKSSLNFRAGKGIRIGDDIIVIGYPLGELLGSGIKLTTGNVSALTGLINDTTSMQLTAPIQPGNSGGPLFDINGEVIGINTAIASSGQGIGFAIPINMVKRVVEQIIKFGKVKRAWLGVTIQRVSKSFSRSLGLKKSEGALVVDVVKDSPADKSGILKGDLILKFGDKKLKKSSDLPILVSLSSIGDEKKLLILRDGEKKIVTVKLEDSDSEKKVSIKKNRKNQLGIDVRKATKKERKKGKGVVVSYIEDNSLIFKAGIRKNDLILKINDFEVSSKEEFHKELKNRKNSMIIFYIKRKNNYLYVAFRL
jgi:serine protease Do